MPLVFPSTHPLLREKVGLLRSTETRPPEFRRLVRCLTSLLGYEATADLPTRGTTVQTPLGPSPASVLADPVLIVPILRAGLGMADGLIDLIPEAEVWHVGLKRDEETLLPEEYYNKLPAIIPQATVFVVDPMLATGGSAVHACEILKQAGAGRIKYLALIAAPEGIERLSAAMPDVAIHVGAVDEKLDHRGYIYPGLGDAGDRQFATFEREG